eukprot:TRINITY_DN62194_c0_g1_i1.p1 TRINITY_DN62194_c0_g1~~TRINITY_DN62194_c0_g1_i1.p1  ORF type:complete len:531 (+),score=84.33 TRINITY_DN62194_c0_g1_i1:52-1644(+)
MGEGDRCDAGAPVARTVPNRNDTTAKRGVCAGLDVRNDEVLGNVLFVTRRFQRGERVLCEDPLVVVESPWGLKDELSVADLYIRDAVMEMCFCPVMGPKKKELRRDATSVLTLGAIMSSNGHAYRHCEPEDEHTTGEGDSKEVEQIALYHIGSKAQHSCAPNCAFRCVAGQLVYTALADIEVGDQVTFSYCLDWRDLQLPTFLRRELVKSRRGFDCLCRRCSDPCDRSRALPCSACGCSRTFLPEEPTKQRSAWWFCQACGIRLRHEDDALSCRILDDEIKLGREVVESADKMLRDARACDEISAALLWQLLRTCADRLGPLHWTVAACRWRILSLVDADTGARGVNDERCVEARDHYRIFREFLAHIGLEDQVPTAYHVLTLHLCTLGVFSDADASDLCADVFPLYQSVHGSCEAVDRLILRLGGREKAAALCDASGIAAHWLLSAKENVVFANPASGSRSGANSMDPMEHAVIASSMMASASAVLPIVARDAKRHPRVPLSIAWPVAAGVIIIIASAAVILLQRRFRK